MCALGPRGHLVVGQEQVDRVLANWDVAMAKVAKYELKVKMKSSKSAAKTKGEQTEERKVRVTAHSPRKGEGFTCQQYGAIKAGLVTKVSTKHTCPKGCKMEQESLDSNYKELL